MLKKINSTAGTARLIVILAVIALALLAIIIVPKVIDKSNESLRAVDEQQETTARRQALVEYQLTNAGFTAVFETETKKFIAPDKARRTVEPYGATKETEGQYLLVTVTDDGEVTTEWVTP